MPKPVIGNPVPSLRKRRVAEMDITSEGEPHTFLDDHCIQTTRIG